MSRLVDGSVVEAGLDERGAGVEGAQVEQRVRVGGQEIGEGGQCVEVCWRHDIGCATVCMHDIFTLIADTSRHALNRNLPAALSGLWAQSITAIVFRCRVSCCEHFRGSSDVAGGR